MFAHAVHQITLALAVFATSVSAAKAQQHTWTDSSGKFSVEAELAEAKQDSVVLKKSSGKLITVPVARLSETDRQYLEALAQEPMNEPLRSESEFIAAWKEAGALFHPVAEDVPAFHFEKFPSGKLNALPQPEVPFGLSFRSVTGAELKELAGLTQLQTLSVRPSTCIHGAMVRTTSPCSSRNSMLA